MLPFIKRPSEAKFLNNESALTNSAFVREAIEDMLLLGTIKQAKTPVEVNNPLPLSVNSKGKKQVILDYINRFYHINIFQTHQTYLGFSWVFNGTTNYFIFTVLPFGLSSAPFLFTNIVRPLVKFHQNCLFFRRRSWNRTGIPQGM